MAKQEGEAVFKQKLEIESKNVLSSEPQPEDLRVSVARPIFEIYLSRSQYEAAISFCTRLIEVLNDRASLSTVDRQLADLKQMGFKNSDDLDQVDQLQALSSVHRMLAQVFTRMGDRDRQGQELAIADRFAEDASTKLELAKAAPGK